jgi:hypothetical protein
MAHKGNPRRKVKSTQVQAMLDTIQRRITDDPNLTAEQLVQLSNTAAILVQSLDGMDKVLLTQRKKKRTDDLFAKRPNPTSSS